MEHSILTAVYSVAITAIAYYSYYYLSQFKTVSGAVKKVYPGCKEPEAVEFLSAKLTGFFLLGVVPLVIFLSFFPLSFKDLGLSWARTGQYWYLIIAIPAVAVSIMSQATKGQANLAVYPQMRITSWTTRYIFISLSGWTLYLVSYEFLFRGILWFLCYAAFGFWPALVINLALYSAFHMTKGIGETVGAIPLGALVCLFTWLTGSIFLAFLTHISIAASSELFSIYYNPQMKFRIQSNKRSS